MLESKKGSAPPPPSARSLTLGATRERLVANGYLPVSMLMPFVPQDPSSPWKGGTQSPPPWLVSEHPAAVQTLGGGKHLAGLILTPQADAVLDRRTRAVLERAGLTRGPVRVGTDRRELWPLRAASRDAHGVALKGAVEMVGVFAGGMGTGLLGCLLPLDGAWPRGDLLSVPYEKLPDVGDWRALFSELDRLPFQIAQEQRPPPKPSRRSWLGAP